MKTFSVSCAFDPYVKLCPDLNIAFFYFILYSNFVLHAIFDSVVLLLALLSLYIWLHNMNNSWNIRRIWIHYNEYKAIFSDIKWDYLFFIQYRNTHELIQWTNHASGSPELNWNQIHVLGTRRRSALNCSVKIKIIILCNVGNLGIRIFVFIGKTRL